MNISMTSFADELVKIAASAPGSAVSRALELIGKHKGAVKYPAIGGGSVAAYVGGKQAKDDWKLGRTIRQRHEESQSG